MASAAPAAITSYAGGPLLEVNGLRKYFPVRGGVWGRVVNQVRAVEDVSFSIAKGETLGLVGESGCGKSTLARVVLRLLEPSAGSVRFAGTDLYGLGPRELRQARRRMQIIFQDPYSSLNPRHTVGEAVAEPIRVHGLLRGVDVERRVSELLERVGLPSAARARYPHEFSGGERQRVCIARALALEPELLVCDEAVSALDISIQAQILNLLEDLQQQHGLSYLFISHNLNVVRHIADRIGVMYLGKLVELGDAETVFSSPQHPYTRALIAANPLPDPDAPLAPLALEGEPPSALDPPGGCRFHPRCAQAFEPCSTLVPLAHLTGAADGSPHRVWCHLYNDAPQSD